MDQSQRALIKQLEELGRGDVPSAKAVGIVREALTSSNDLAPYVHAALSDATWRLIATRSFNDDLVAWHEAFRQAEALMEDRSPELAIQTRTLTNLIAKSHRFFETQPASDVIGRKHVREILSFVTEAGGRATRLALREHVGLLDANLSRVLFILTTSGLLERHGEGREAHFSITLDGTAALAADAPDRAATRNPPFADEAWQESFVTAIWDKTGSLVTSTNAFDELARERATSAKHAPDLQEWMKVVGNLSGEQTDIDPNRNYEMGSKDRTFACQFRETSDGRVAFSAYDVSAYVRKQKTLEDDCSFLTTKVASLKKELADLRHSLVVQEAVQRPILEAINERAREYEKVLSDRLQHQKGWDVVASKALTYLGHAVPLGLERHWNKSYDNDLDLPSRYEPVPPKQLVEEVMRRVGLLTEKTIPVNGNFKNSFDVNEMVSDTLVDVSACFVNAFKDALDTTANVTTNNDNLVIILSAKQLSQGDGHVYNVGGWFENCHDLLRGTGGDLKWSQGKNEAEMRIFVPASSHR